MLVRGPVRWLPCSRGAREPRRRHAHARRRRCRHERASCVHGKGRLWRRIAPSPAIPARRSPGRAAAPALTGCRSRRNAPRVLHGALPPRKQRRPAPGPTGPGRPSLGTTGPSRGRFPGGTHLGGPQGRSHRRRVQVSGRLPPGRAAACWARPRRRGEGRKGWNQRGFRRRPERGPCPGTGREGHRDLAKVPTIFT